MQLLLTMGWGDVPANHNYGISLISLVVSLLVVRLPFLGGVIPLGGPVNCDPHLLGQVFRLAIDYSLVPDCSIISCYRLKPVSQ